MNERQAFTFAHPLDTADTSSPQMQALIRSLRRVREDRRGFLVMSILAVDR